MSGDAERRERIRVRVLDTISRGPRARGPIKLGLLRRGFLDAEIDQTIDDLVREGKVQEYRALDGKRRLKSGS